MKVPSAEGPLTGKDTVSFSYTTIPPFNVVSCNPTGLVSYSRTNVTPTIYFSHPLVHENGSADDMAWAPKIKPAPPKGSWKIFGGNRTAIQYETEGNVNWPMATAYTVKVHFEFTFFQRFIKISDCVGAAFSLWGSIGEKAFIQIQYFSVGGDELFPYWIRRDSLGCAHRLVVQPKDRQKRIDSIHHGDRGRRRPVLAHARREKELQRPQTAHQEAAP